MHILSLSIFCSVSAHKVFISDCWGHLWLIGKPSECPTEAPCKLLDPLSAWRLTSICTNTGFLALGLPTGLSHEEALGRDSQPGSGWGQEHPPLLLPCAVRCDLVWDQQPHPDSFCKGFLLVVLILLPAYLRYCNMLATKLKIVL